MTEVILHPTKKTEKYRKRSLIFADNIILWDLPADPNWEGYTCFCPGKKARILGRLML